MTVALLEGLIPHPTQAALRVEIPMPVFFGGKRAGEPVGWLAINQKPTTVAESIVWNAAVSAWRVGARDGYRKVRVPKLDRVYVTFAVRYAAKTSKSHRHDAPNLEPTYKPIVDALQPQRVEMREKTKKVRGRSIRTKEPVIHYGWGVIPNDNAAGLVRGGQWIGEDLEPGSPHGGMIVAYVFPYAGVGVP